MGLPHIARFRLAVAWMIVWMAALGLGCASPEPLADKTILLSTSVGTVVALPMNVAAPLPSSLGTVAPDAWEVLRTYLRAHDATLKTVSLQSSRGLWRESVRAAREASPEAGFPEAAAIFVERLSHSSEFDYVLFPSLFAQGALLSGRTARWDGAEQQVDVDEGPWSERIDDETEFGGAVPAVSLHAAVLDKNGRMVHERQAGLVLLSRIRITGSPELDAPRFEAEAVEDPFADRDALVRGIARALDPWLTPLAPADVGE